MVPVALCPHFLYFHSFTSAPVPHCPPLYLCSLLLPFTSTLFSTFYYPLFCLSSQFSLLSLALPQLFPVLTFSLAHLPITSVFFLPPLLTLFPIFSMILSSFLPFLSPCSLFSPTSLLFPTNVSTPHSLCFLSDTTYFCLQSQLYSRVTLTANACYHHLSVTNRHPDIHRFLPCLTYGTTQKS